MKLVVLTGAGISAESGLRTFRGHDGLWEHEPIEAVATPEGYFRDKKRVRDFYNGLRRGLPQYEPNAAHRAIAKLEAQWGDDLLLVTQNVDDLHERAGSKRVLHMHGALNQLRCEKHENHVFDFWGEEDEKTICPVCGGATRPHVVWFGEVPLYMDIIEKALHNCNHFVYIGTSSVVYPAAGFKRIAHTHGAHVTCLNLEIDRDDSFTDTFVEGKASEVVPVWCQNFSPV